MPWRTTSSITNKNKFKKRHDLSCFDACETMAIVGDRQTAQKWRLNVGNEGGGGFELLGGVMVASQGVFFAYKPGVLWLGWSVRFGRSGLGSYLLLLVDLRSPAPSRSGTAPIDCGQVLSSTLFSIQVSHTLEGRKPQRRTTKRSRTGDWEVKAALINA